MKVLNLSEGTVFLDDINVAVLYSRDNTPFDVPDLQAAGSRALRYAISSGLLMDVTNGMPKELPGKKDASDLKAQESPYLKRQDVLVKDDHSGHDHGPAPKIRVEGPSAISDFKNEGRMSVVYSGPAQDAGGYSLMNRRFMFGLDEKGVGVNYDMLPSMPDMDPATMAKLQRLAANRVPTDAPKIYGMTAPLHYDWARYKMLFTMMETRRLHKDYVIRCNCADEIVVPSKWCRDVFVESGVKKPITVVPLGVDTDMYKPGVEPIAFSRNLRDFVFLSVFGWSLRKGYDVLLKAYFEEFTGDEPVSLVLSTRYFGSADESKKQVIRDEIAKIRSMTANRNQPHLAFFGDVLSDEMMPRLFAAANCYVLISRGEGFGLPFLESGACGIPVIASRYSGQTDFLDDSNSYLVDVDGFRSAEKELAWISYFYEDAEFPIFGEKSVEQTRHLMRHVYEHRDEANAKAALLRERVLKEYDWSTCVDQMYEVLKLTYGNLTRS